MGWTGTHKPKYMSMKEFFSGEFNGNRENYKGEVIDCSTVRRTECYIAYKITTPEEEKIIAIVCMIRWQRGYHNIMYKDMEESMGPYYYNCPKRILGLLSPTDNKNALEWRKICWENITKREATKKLTIGTKIIFPAPIEFFSGYTGNEFIVKSLNPLRFTASDNSFYTFKIKKSLIYTATII